MKKPPGTAAIFSRKTEGAPAENFIQSTMIDVDGVPMHTRVSNNAAVVETPPVVFVHGLALSGRYMLPTAHTLLHHHRVYLPDLPGFGDSAKPRHVLDVPELAEALSAWMKAAGIERAMLLGNSFGCQIIAELAARHPEQVERGVLQGPTAPPEDRTWLRQFLSWRANAPFMTKEMNDIAHSDYRKCGIVRALGTFNFSIKHAMEDLLPRIDAPMLVVRGERDPICHQHWAETVSRGLRRGRLLILPAVAHTLVFTSPLALAGACLPFFNEHREHDA